jgi:AcrR family transcriptional regulator
VGEVAISGTGSQRERVFEGAMHTMAELGPIRATMRELSARVGMSPGHILYYFGSKDRVFLETVRWSEEQLLDSAAERVAAIGGATGQLREVIEVYLPTSARDPRWLLWAYVYARPPEDQEGRTVIEALDHKWDQLLVEILTAGMKAREIDDVDAAQEAHRLRLYMDGLAMNLLLGFDASGRDWFVSEAISSLDGITVAITSKET